MLKNKFESICSKYINKFAERYELFFDGWIGDVVGEVACFGDYFIDFSDVRYLVDNKISEQTFFNYYYFNTEFIKCHYKLDAFVKLERDFASKYTGSNFANDFDKYLLYLRVQSYKTV